MLFNNIPVPTVVWKSRHDHLIMAEYNDAALQYTGGKILSLMGKTVEECNQNADRPISLAAGFSTARSGDDIDALIAKADRRMYQEKARMKAFAGNIG